MRRTAFFGDRETPAERVAAQGAPALLVARLIVSGTMPRLDRLPEANRTNLLNLPMQVNEGAPYARLARPLAAVRLAQS